jgi:hypothetical protein
VLLYICTATSTASSTEACSQSNNELRFVFQQELVAGYISGRLALPSASAMQKELLQRDEVKQQPWRPQFPHTDYIGHMFNLAHVNNKIPSFLQHAIDNKRQRSDTDKIDLKEKEGLIVIPALFGQDTSTLQDLQRTLKKFRNGYLIARNIFYSLSYTHSYDLEREITDHRSGSISIVTGTVIFRAIDRNPYRLLYQEEGKILLQGKSYDVSQAYIYEYNHEKDCIDISFSKVCDKEVIDRPFISLSFNKMLQKEISCTSCGRTDINSTPSPGARDEDGVLSSIADARGWTSTANHLCGEDMYHAAYTFAFAGLRMKDIYIVFDAQGPSKDYRSVTKLTANKDKI